MTTSTEFDVAVSYLEDIEPGIALDLIADLSNAGLRVQAEPRENAPMAGVEWLLPTAFFVYLTDKYFGTMIQEAAKEHYPAVRDAMLRFLGRTVGMNRQVRTAFVVSHQSPNKLSRERPGAVSVYATLRSGHKVKFAFDDTMEPEVHAVALDALLSALQEHYEKDRGQLTIAGQSQERPGLPIVMRYDQATSSWKHWRLEEMRK